MAAPMLTTLDNPFDPFTEFTEWYAFDEDKGYHTSGLLARYASTSDELSSTDLELVIDQAIDYVLQDHALGQYKKVYPKPESDGLNG